MFPTHTTDHVAQGLANLTSRFRDKPNVAALLSAILKEVQRAEDAAWDVVTKCRIGEALAYADDPGNPDPDLVRINLDGSGAQLDPIGDLVGEARNGRSDADYLVGIKCRIRANGSLGTWDDILRIMRLAVGSTGAFEYGDSVSPSPLGFWLRAYSFPGGGSLLSILDSAREGGVRGVLEFTDAPSTGSLLFTDANDEPVTLGSNASGLSSTTPAVDAGLSLSAQEF